ncbi:MAG: metalloregulator ArsR/SmtB family transcription factor [Candidatus Diapherotrites archaeon]
MQNKKVLPLIKALADETRLKIVELLLGGERCVCEIFPKVKRTQSTVSIQLAKLERAGIIKHRREGKKIFYRIADRGVCDIFRALGCEKGGILKKTCCTRNKKGRSYA